MRFVRIIHISTLKSKLSLFWEKRGKKEWSQNWNLLSDKKFLFQTAQVIDAQPKKILASQPFQATFSLFFDFCGLDTIKSM